MRVKVKVIKSVEGHKWVDIESVEDIYKYGFIENLETFESDYEWGVEATIVTDVNDSTGRNIAGTYTDDDGKRHIAGWKPNLSNEI